jgi:holo-[acyl-carrier protein] synthase
VVNREQHLPLEVRVGIDLMRIDECANAIARFGQRYLSRLFTPHELECCRGDPQVVAAGLAARFAAKEATIKVLRVSGPQPRWRSMELCRHQNGWCEIRLTETAARLATQEGIRAMAVSMTHDSETAAAVVVAVCEQSED